MTEREVFIEALRRESPVERAEFLDGACGDNETLRKRIEALLARHAVADPRIDCGPVDLLQAISDTTEGLGPKRAIDAKELLEKFLVPSDRSGAVGRLDHYDILEVLGQGGFGIVVKAFDTRLERLVAIKLLAPSLAATSPPRKRFLREARAVALVKHEHVVQMYAVEEQPLPYLVMEYIDGPTLQRRLDEMGPLDPADVVRIGQQIARGLAAAHEKGLIHRDVKPANILMDHRGPEANVKLTDFGLARAADDASLTQSGVMAGTPLFMSPEQVRGDVLDARSDLFSLGSVLYTLLAGRPPFRASTPFAVFQRVAEDTPRPLQDVIGGVPPGLIDVINRLLAKKPQYRYASALEVADALATCLTAPPPRRSRERWLMGSAVVLVLIGVGLGLGYRFNQQHRDTAEQVNEPPNAPAEVPREQSDPLPSPQEPARPEPTPTVPTPSTFPPAKPIDAEFVVNSTLDEYLPGTLRWAVTEANKRPGEYLITFAPEMRGRTISVNAPMVMDGSGRSAFTIQTRITIEWPSWHPGVTLAAGTTPNLRAFSVEVNGRLTLKNVTVRGFTIQGKHGEKGHGGGGGGFALGGAVSVHGEFTAVGCSFVSNTVVGGNGGDGLPNGPGGNGNGIIIVPGGTSDPQDQVGGMGKDGEHGCGGGGGGFGSQRAGPGGRGGFGAGGGGGAAPGLSHFGGGTGGGSATRAGGGGGGAGLGGAIFSLGSNVTLVNCTFTENTARGGKGGTAVEGNGTPGRGYGGAIFARNSSLKVINCTIYQNTAEMSGGIYAVTDELLRQGERNTTEVAVYNTILAGTPNEASDIGGEIIARNPQAMPTPFQAVSGSCNIVGRNGPGGLPANAIAAAIVDFQIDRHLDYIGPGISFVPIGKNPAINAGDNSQIPPGITHDQNGSLRIRGGRVDIGSVEGR